MRIGILGQPCIDEIVAPDGTCRNALGGILYSYAATDRAMEDGDEIVPLTWYNASDAPLLEPLLSRLNHLDRRTGLWLTRRLTNRVRLIYTSAAERTEHCHTILPPLGPKELTPEVVASLDGIFVNMISGYDIGVETAEHLFACCTSARPTVHLDLHALALGELSLATGEDDNFGKGREPRAVPDWRRWLASAHTVQMNELEARWTAAGEANSESDFLQLLRRERKAFPQLQAIVITRAERGASAYDIHTGEEWHAAPPTVTPVDTTGSGDVFGAIFLLERLRGAGIERALQSAVQWASWNTTLQSAEDIMG